MGKILNRDLTKEGIQNGKYENKKMLDFACH